jgi:hypothetical protein
LPALASNQIIDEEKYLKGNRRFLTGIHKRNKTDEDSTEPLTTKLIGSSYTCLI